jgi:cell division protein FtsB
LAEIEREIEYYRAMNEALMEQVETLKSPEQIEKVAREKLGLVMPGEVQYMLVTKAE